MTDHIDDLAIQRGQVRYESCTVRELFVELRRRNPTQAFAVLRALLDVDKGLRLRLAAPGYIGDDEIIHHGDVSAALVKAERAGEIDSAEATIRKNPIRRRDIDHIETIYGDEVPLHDLWILRTELESACRAIGMQEIPWPETEDSAAYAVHLRREKLLVEQDRISALPATTAGDEKLKQARLNEIEKKIKALEVGGTKDISAQERATLLRTIGALALTIVAQQKGNKFGTADKPSISQIAQAVAETIKDREGRAPHGLGDTALRTRIADGLKLLRS
ncbi:MAG: hypothetical protein H0W93_03435 [Gammaproteobacteria bacterium]|nr:hypothetical protein [Gammaproteobacteria bacterium]